MKRRSLAALDHHNAMFSRHIASRIARPLARLSSSSSSVPAAARDAAKAVAPQAPNYATTWSTSQAPRPAAHSGPRFEQTAMELQPNPLSAMEMIANEPIRVVHGRKAVCDGGMSSDVSDLTAGLDCSTVGVGPLGHPKIFINLVCSTLYRP